MSQTQCEPDFKVEILRDHADASDQSERLTTASRRNDLQGIRGMAIVAVLLFHFFPQTFPNGHIGVDQFFVLSGFLMSMISNRQKQFAFYEVASFYYRRVKRIVPSYLLVILLSLICSSFILPVYLQSFNIESAKLALSFTTNIAATNISRDYQNMVSKAEDLFTHTWSIAVEMQFYIIFPLIFVIYKVLPGSGSVGMIFLTVLCVISAWYHFTLPPPEAFNLMQSRIWQFVLGIFVNQLECRKMDGVNRFESSFLHYACLIPVVLVSFWVHPLDRAFTRLGAEQKINFIGRPEA
ncbi:acyltransferase [Ancylostoma caninum]|uniref:Acyltransferase n=1 Tax=Ancylostoma caninum TaxID=29170 RepID=A0A368HA05_ANCCA|nr:acyltransferase [Ancylostoma caninum]